VLGVDRSTRIPAGFIAAGYRALVATGQVAQITFHLNNAMDNGLTKAQASEVLTHLAFYTGWPNVMSSRAGFQGRLRKARRLRFHRDQGDEIKRCGSIPRA
jgi:Carboxymuconolactone decarboxylase family